MPHASTPISIEHSSISSQRFKRWRFRAVASLRTKAFFAAGALVFLLIHLVGCNLSGSEKRAELKSISAAIDRLRQAANSEKASKLSELSKVPCSIPDTCGLRDQCTAAYRLQVETLDEIAAGAGHLDPEHVARIEQKLEAARNQAHECLERELVVGRRYGMQI